MSWADLFIEAYTTPVYLATKPRLSLLATAPLTDAISPDCISAGFPGIWIVDPGIRAAQHL